MSAIIRGIALLTVTAVLPLCASGQNSDKGAFVQRVGARLTLGGATFRYGGPNIEWLGLEGYGVLDPTGPRHPSRFEIDDAFSTAAEMGARVVRSQTMGDTVGCAQCIEPEKGKFNEAGFQAVDYALAAASRRGMRIIITLLGDCASCQGSGIGQYLAWEGKQNPQDFFTDPELIATYENHIDAVLNHVNSLNGVRYKDDPTVLAWENCNMCGLIPLLMGGGPTALAQVSDWVETIGQHIKQQDTRHLYLDTSGIFRAYPKVLDNKSTDLVTFEYYPHWDALLGTGEITTAATFSRDAALVTGRGKVFVVNEFGWDRTDWKTPQDLQKVLDTLTNDPNISGDDYWALLAHLETFGFQLIPDDTNNLSFAEHGESGQWWALYYPGINTRVNSADDMAARAQQLRAHAYAMSGTPVPQHLIPPAPVITSVFFGLIAWRGSAGAVKYSIERKGAGATQWKVICDRCATDVDNPWGDPHGGLSGGSYRVIAYNADGVPSEPSPPR